jgi:hypothetical protein
MVQERQLQDEEPEPEETDERALKFIELFEEERRRRQHLRQSSQR